MTFTWIASGANRGNTVTSMNSTLGTINGSNKRYILVSNNCHCAFDGIISNAGFTMPSSVTTADGTVLDSRVGVGSFPQ